MSRVFVSYQLLESGIFPISPSDDMFHHSSLSFLQYIFVEEESTKGFHGNQTCLCYFKANELSSPTLLGTGVSLEESWH